MNRSEARLVHRLGHKKTLSSFSRVGLAQDLINPISKSESYASARSKLMHNRRLFVGREPTVPLRVRVAQALQAQSSPRPSSRRPRIRHSSTFVSTSREYHQSLVRPQAPPLGSYYPKFETLLRATPCPSFSRAESVRWPSLRSALEEPGLSCSRSRKIETRELRLPGVSFAKQVRRAAFVDPRKGPHERRFMHVASSSFDSAQVHSFDSYSSRAQLFPSPDYLPDYDPKYSFTRHRLQKVKNGVALPEVAATQKKDFSVPQLADAGARVVEPEFYSPQEALRAPEPSPGMREYLSLKSFSPAAERKKISNLPNFFFVTRTQEKFHLLSNELSEPLLLGAVNKAKCDAHMSERRLQEQHTRAFNFENDISEVNETIKRHVNEQFERQRNEAEQAERRREAQQLFLKTLTSRKPAHLPLKQLPVQSTQASPSSGRHPLLRELLKLHAAPLPNSPKQLRGLSKCQTPHQAIQENRRMQRNLYHFFTHKNS